MKGIDLPVGALVERDGVLLRHVGGGRFVPHVPDPRDALPDEAQMVKRFDTSSDGPILGGAHARAEPGRI